MRVAIHQPHYLPWLPYIHKISSADLFIMLDDAAYTKNGWQNRNKIKGADGWMYLTVPVRASLNQPICSVEIAEPSWGAAHLAALRTNYGRAPYLADHAGFFADIYRQRWTRLQDVSEAVLRYCLDQLEIRVPIIHSSQLGVAGSSTARLVALCRSVGATCYLSGRYAAETYLDPAQFERAGIALELHAWRCPEYRQLFPRIGFIPDLSVVDLLFNEGPRSSDVLRRGGPSRCSLPAQPY